MSERDRLVRHIQNALHDDRLVKAVLSRPRTKSTTPPRIDVRPVLVQGQRRWQFAERIDNREVHANLTTEDAATRLKNEPGERFRDLLLKTSELQIQARTSRRGDLKITERWVDADSAAEPVEHNRQRNYLLPEGQPIPFLVATGIMNDQGRVRGKYYRKFRQINRYVEFLQDMADQLPKSGRLRVVDFGSGKSYLTFAVHHYFTHVLQREVEIVGLELREDVVRQCRQMADSLQLDSIRFEAGQISGYQPDGEVHLAISLHACDTATDDALAAAVQWNADVIMAVPCCHHELSSCLSRDWLPEISRHGILHERFCETTTDAVRAALLDRVGYRATVSEFIEMEHTPRNVLIRAIRRDLPAEKASNPNDPIGLPRFFEDFQLPTLRLQRKLEEFGRLSPSPTSSPSAAGTADPSEPPAR